MAALKQHTLEALVGQPAAVAYRTVLLAHTQVCGCTVFHYRSPPRLHERVSLGDCEQSIVDEALEVRKQTQLPFWQTVFMRALKRGECTEALVSGALFHSGPGDGTPYTRADVDGGVLERVSLSGEANVGLGSEIRTACFPSLHLNFLDFHCDVSNANTGIAMGICRALLPRGFLLLDSGDSYHAAGLALVSKNERIATLGRALLVAPIADIYYIAHQLQQDLSSIRISKGGRAKKLPTVIDVWAPV